MTKQLSPLRRKDQATGYQAAVKDIVAWLREGFKRDFDQLWRDQLTNEIEAKFGKGVDTV